MRAFSRSIHDIDASLESLLIGTSHSFNSSINNGNVAVFISDGSHSVQREPAFVNGEILVVYHVVNVTPDCVQGQIVLLVVVQNLFKVADIFVSPSALMESETPEGRNG